MPAADGRRACAAWPIGPAAFAPRPFPAPPFSSEANVGVGISERVAPAQTFKSPTRQAHLPVWTRAAQRHGRLGGSASPIRPLPVLPRGGSGLLRTPA